MRTLTFGGPDLLDLFEVVDGVFLHSSTHCTRIIIAWLPLFLEFSMSDACLI